MRRGCGGCRRSGFAAEDFEHDGVAGRAFAFDGLAPVFHGFFQGINYFLLGLTFDAVSFRHKFFKPPRHFMCEAVMESSLGTSLRQRNPEKKSAQGLAE